jgi:hypothetical protein
MGTIDLVQGEGSYECYTYTKNIIAKAQGLVELPHQHLGGMF